MISGEIPFLSKGQIEEIGKKYDGRVVFSAGDSDYKSQGCIVLASTEQDEWRVLHVFHGGGIDAHLGVNTYTAEKLLEYLTTEGGNIVKHEWKKFLEDRTGNHKHTGPSYEGLVETLKFDTEKEDA